MNEKRQITKGLNTRLTAHYAGIHACYWGSLAIISGFASVYLLYRGFTNSQIGIMMALANVLTVFLQPIVSSFADKTQKVSLNQMLFCLLAGMIVLFVLLVYAPDVIALVAVLFALIRILANVVVPLMDSLGFRMERHGVTVNYGIARAAGSVTYALLSAVIGLVVERYSEAMLPWLCVLVYGVMIVLVVLFHLPKNVEQRETVDKPAQKEKKEIASSGGVIGFFRKYPGYLTMQLGFMFIAITHMTIFCTYYYQVIVYKGGDSAILGSVASLSAMLEIPVIASFGWLKQKIRCSSLLRVAAVFYSIKALAQWILPGVGGIYFAGVLQIFAYAIAASAMVYFVNSLMAPEDAVKGQGYAASATTIGSVIGSLLGGWVLDVADPQVLLMLCTVISTVGTVIVLIGMRRPEGEEGKTIPEFLGSLVRR